MAEDLPPVLTLTYERFDEDTTAAADTGRELGDHKPVHRKEIEVEREEAQQALQDIQDAIDERSQYWVIGEIVVGVETYLKADIYARCAYDESVDTVCSADITVVPSDMVAPVIPTEKRLEEHLVADDA